MKKLAWILPLFLALVFVPLWSLAQQEAAKKPAPGAATEQHGQKHHGGETGKGSDQQHQMMEKCKEMMGKHDQLQADMKAMDARLDEKLGAMNAAKGEEKSTAMAAVLNEMAAQRKEMRDKMSAMHHQGMCAMCGKMGHGGMGGMGGMKGHGGGKDGGMAGCGAMMDKHGSGGGGT